MSPRGGQLSQVLAAAGRVVFHAAGGSARNDLAAATKVTVVGSLEEVRAAAVAINPATAALLEDFNENSEPLGTVQTETLFDPATKQRLSCVCVPRGTGRNTAASRPELVLSALGGKLGGSHVLIGSQKVEDAVAVALAVARCAPPLTLKSASGDSFRDANPVAPVNVVFETDAVDAPLVKRLQAVADAIRAAQLLVDAPPCVLNAETFEEFVRDQVEGLPGVSVTAIVGEELVKRGMGGLYGVGKAAAVPPRMLVLSHAGAKGGSSGQSSVCLAGKGIVYDTGGLSIKSTAGMCGMKFDMGGAAGQFGAFLAAATLGGIDEPLHCVLCLAENAVNEQALRNDDVITMYSGLTVEVNNTDAEGRLVLGDGVAYAAKHLSPRLVVDMATLTGAQGIATGEYHSALYCNDAATEAAAVAAGLATGDYAFPILYAPELHLHEFNSTIADMRNSVKNRVNAQCSCAGSFILRHLFAAGYDGPALHVDMAYPVKEADRATGYGVALICKLLGVL